MVIHSEAASPSAPGRRSLHQGGARNNEGAALHGDATAPEQATALSIEDEPDIVTISHGSAIHAFLSRDAYFADSVNRRFLSKERALDFSTDTHHHGLSCRCGEKNIVCLFLLPSFLFS